MIRAAGSDVLHRDTGEHMRRRSMRWRLSPFRMPGLQTVTTLSDLRAWTHEARRRVPQCRTIPPRRILITYSRRTRLGTSSGLRCDATTDGKSSHRNSYRAGTDSATRPYAQLTAPSPCNTFSPATPRNARRQPRDAGGAERAPRPRSRLSQRVRCQFVLTTTNRGVVLHGNFAMQP